jgi:DNA-directed RNA polymerase specialized sigma24 family protein
MIFRAACPPLVKMLYMAHSVSLWIEQLKTGDHDAAQKLWESYFGKLVRLARAHLRGAARAAADEEDVVLSAFDSFCRGAELGRFPQLADRNDLWQLLVLITRRKSSDLFAFNARRKRSAAATRSLDRMREADAGFDPAGNEPTPDFAVQIAEEVQRLLSVLGKDDLRTLALWKMEGYANREIADRLGCVERTVERKLWVIRQIWENEDVERA